MMGEAAFERPALRSDDDKFSFKSTFFCGQPAMAGNKRKDFDVISVRTIELKDTVLTVCQERNDSWHIVYWHEFQVLMTCMQQMQSTTKLVISIFVQ